MVAFVHDDSRDRGASESAHAAFVLVHGNTEDAAVRGQLSPSSTATMRSFLTAPGIQPG